MRPVVVSVGPLAAADDNGIVASQTPAGAGQLALNGALTDFSATSIAAAQTLAQADDLVLTDSRVYLAGNQYVVITSVGDDTGVTFTITGVALGNVGVTETITGANAGFVVSTKTYSQIISISTDGATANDVSVGTWSAATLDEARRVLLTFGADETGTNFTVTGTDRYGNPISEVVAGAAATASTLLDFKTVTSVAIDGAAAGTIIVGTSGVAASDWVRFDDWTQNMLSIQANVSGTVNYTIQSSLDDPNSPTDPVAVSAMTWFDSNDSNLTAETTAKQSNTQIMPTYARVLLNSGSGTVTATFTQFAQGAW
jgi:hypothetical protein